jgi:hypothetical protein
MVTITKCSDCPIEDPTIEDCITRFKNGEVGCGSDNILLNILERLETLEGQ